jgi:nucleoside-diphosphate-sugar epimerase
MHQRRILVTGGNGFIGRRLIRRLLAEGHALTLLQRSREHPPGISELLQIDRLDPDVIERAVSGRQFDWVFHLAGYGVHPHDRDVRMMFDVNVKATIGMLNLARSWSPRAVILAATGSEYRLEGAESPITEVHPLEPFRLYPTSKAAGTLCAASIARNTQVPFAAGRIFQVYGPGERSHRLLPSLIRALRAGKRVPLSPGTQVRDFVHVDDVVDAFLSMAQALETKPDQLILNICSGIPTTVRSFAEIVARSIGHSVESLGFGDLNFRPDDAPYMIGDPARVRAFANWRPRFDLNSGIRSSIMDDEANLEPLIEPRFAPRDERP